MGTDLFQIGKQHQLIVVDYYSHFPEVIKLSSTTSQAVISALKPIFARYRIPETVYSDNGPHYQSGEFKQFAREYDFNHVTSSPHFPQSNGLIERTVQTVKKLLQDSDPCLALLNIGATPLNWCRLCPSVTDGKTIEEQPPFSSGELSARLVSPQTVYSNGSRV